MIAAVVDTQKLTLYTEDGETVVIPQGDPRLATIMGIVVPILGTGHGAVAEVDISDGMIANPYSEFETLFGKAIQFFKVDKTKLADWLNKAANLVTEVVAEVVKAEAPATVIPMTLGKLPAVSVETDNVSKVQKLLNVTEEIIAHAQPVSHPQFHDENTGTNGKDTIVAVVGNNVVADIEKLKPQITRAVQTNSPKGVQAFMARVATVADKRRHSVEDLLKFLEKGDLPIADDGTIVIYKVLRLKTNDIIKRERTYVDCHTRKVTQRVGSYVCMDEKLVDPSRSNECSNGLHVARRAYLDGFSGDVCVLAKVKPEDVIAVPDHDANKMRVCGYHILFELSEEAFQLLKKDRSFTDNDTAQLLLGRALAGDHIWPIEEVRITEHMGEGVKITPLTKKVEIPKAEVKLAEALTSSVPELLDAAPVDPKSVVKQVAQVKAEAETRATKAKRLYADFKHTKDKTQKGIAAAALYTFKRSSKLSWTALGLSESTGEALKPYLALTSS